VDTFDAPPMVGLRHNRTGTVACPRVPVSTSETQAPDHADGVLGGMRPLASLRQRVQALVESWEELQSGSWNAMAAIAQYEELERISASAEQLGAIEIAEPAVELTVYLCTFVESRLYPSNAQRARLADLVARLARVASGDGRPVRSRKPAAEHRAVVYLRPAADEVRDLAAELGRRRYVVRPAVDAAQALAIAEEQAPDALVVHEAMIGELAELAERIDRLRVESRGHLVSIVVGRGIDASRRLFAQRAGADAVIDGDDAVAIAGAVEELVAHRRNLDYRVLIVEDDAAQAKFCEAVLRHRGIQTEVSTSGLDVLDRMAAFRPDLVLLDLYLPGTNGIEIAQLVRERPEWAFLPIVFLSGETDLDKRFDAIRMGGDDFITKPVKPRHLIVEVETRIRRARQLPPRGAERVAGDRRGSLASRSALFDEYRRARDQGDAESLAVVVVGVDDESGLRRRLGFVGIGQLSQQVGVALAAETEIVRPVCAAADLRYVLLARAESDGILRQRLERLRDRLRERRYTIRDEAVQIDPVVVGIGSAGEEPDEILQRALARLALHKGGQGGSVAYDPGARTRIETGDDPVIRLARALLKGPMIPEAIRVEYQAVVPLAGQLGGLYATRFGLIAPRASQRHEVPPERLRSMARQLGAIVQADRHCLRRALGLLAEAVARGDDIRLVLPVAIESVLDPAFAPWLAAELNGRALSPAAVTLELDATEALRVGARLGDALASLQLTGARLGIAGIEGGDAHVRLVRMAPFNLVRLAAVTAQGTEALQNAWGSERGRMIVEATRHGKLTIAHGARDAREIAALMKLSVSYVQSDVFAPWSTEPSFDFAGMRL
jgi:DNA-binding response OmpR family regulator/EAL domain-containing protein (putative c-di-GMP-specific phosphodiesterase class I)